MIVAVVFALAAATSPEVTVSADVVDAIGDQQVILKVSAPAMVRFAVDSEVGTACSFVDHLRGPFLDNGEVGKTSCVVDVLLDSGLYKVRLRSPAAKTAAPRKKGKATVADVPRARITAKAFADLDAGTMTPLLSGQRARVTVPPGAQVTRWFKVPVRQELNLDVVGRTVGDVRLWRDGAFVENVTATTTIVRGEAGRPRWRHRFNTTIDAGEYAVVAYGTNPQRFSTGTDDDSAQLAWNFEPMPDSDTVSITLPAWGYATFGAQYTTALLEVSGAAADDVKLVGRPVMNKRTHAALGFPLNECTVAKGATRRGCTVVGHDEADVLGAMWEVSGPAGARVRLLTVPTRPTSTGLPTTGPADGELDVQLTTTSPPVTDLAVVSLPASTDGPPLSCALESVNDKGEGRVLAVDAPKLGWTQAWQRRFNVDGGGRSLWFVVERAGVYGITTDAKLGASCDVYVVDAAGRRRVDGNEGVCNTRASLPAGLVEVSLSGGLPGIEQFRIGQVGVAALLGTSDDAPARTGCVFSTTGDATLAAALTPGRYRVRTSTTSSEGIVGVYDLGSNSQTMANVVTVDPGRSVRVPLPAGPTVVVNAVGGAGLPDCLVGTTAVKGCVAGDRLVATTMTMTNTTTTPKPVIVSRMPPFSPSATTAPPFSATATAVPVIAAGKPRFFDLSEATPRQFLVDVNAAGLYDLQTEGLLATSCTVRTATTLSLFSGDSNGRGRNCHVEAWLKPGRYLVEVKAVGRSTGRASLNVVARKSVDGGAFAAGDERFVKVPAGQLSTHALTVKRDGPIDLSVTTFTGDLRCRLDDDDGWPVLAVPHACALDQPLNAGRYTLVVLPQNVDNQRALRLLTKTTPTTLTGKATHPLALNTETTVALGEGGFDRFRFVLAADADVGITLTAGMQGRLRKETAGALGDVEHTIAPVGGSGFSIRSSDEGDDDVVDIDTDSSDDEEEEGGYEGGYEEGSGDEGGDGEDDPGASSRATLQAAAVHRAPADPPGQPLSLTAGTWVLEAEHSRGDVGITYTVGVATSALLPGVRLRVQAPALVDVYAPEADGAGLVRIKTRGGTDVACRLVDDNDVVVASSQGSGDDWNCALAVPLSPGSHHRLFIDAEVLTPGPTEVSAEFLEAKSTGPLEDGNAFRVVGKVARADVVPVAGQVTSIELAATEGVFSCAVFDTDGRVLDSATAVKRCPLLVWSGDDVRPFSLLMWTADRPASLKARVLRVSPSRLGGLLDNNVVDDGRVAEVGIDRAGRYATAPNARCIAKSTRGALLPCPTSAAVDPKDDGNALLVAVPRGEKATVSFSEIVVDPASRSARDARRLTGHVDVERQHTDAARLHLVEVAARVGGTTAPSCAIDGGTRALEGDRCFAASSIGTDSQLRLWTKPGAVVDTTVVRAALSVPVSTTTLPTDTAVLKGTSRYALPDAPFRLDAALPADAWAVLVDGSGKSLDVCGPAREDARGKGALRRCVLRGRGGSVVVDGTGAARFDLVRFSAVDEPARELVGLREVVPRMPGREHLHITRATTARVVRIEGAGVQHCRVVLGDGDSKDRCVVDVPAGRDADVFVEHDARAWRALLGGATAVLATRLGSVTTTTATTLLAPNLAVPLSGTVFSRRIDLSAPALVRVRATGGVCGIVSGTRVVAATGFGRGCDLPVQLPAGSHVVAVRGFGGGLLGGTVVVSVDGIATLREGVNDEVLVLPGEARLLRVPLQRDGELGVGVQVDAEVLQCALLDGSGDVVAEGCQLFGRFKKGDYLLRVAVDAADGPRRFRPVVFGLQGAEMDVPDSFLEEFFRRVPRPPPSSTSSSASSSSSSSSAASEVRQ